MEVNKVVWLCLVLLCVDIVFSDGCSLYATNLRVENSQYPLGIDVANPRLSWWLLPSNFSCRNMNQVAYQVLVASSTKQLDKNNGDYWNSQQIQSNNTINVIYRGFPIPSRTRVYWKVIIWDNNKNTWDDYKDNYGWWETPLLLPADWIGSWIQRYYPSSAMPNASSPCDFYKDDPAPLFRKEFTIDHKISQARLYISALGYYEAFINGQKVGNNVLDPGLTTYNQTILYTTYDVTDLVSKSTNNTIGIILGNGWYNPLPMLMFGQDLRKTFSTGFPTTVIAQLVVDYTDGKNFSLGTDTTWQVGAGALLFNNLYLGEVYDARLAQDGWTESGFDSSSWPKAAYNSQNSLKRNFVAQYSPPIRAFGPLLEAGRWTVPNTTNTLVVDLGQNFAGWIQLNVSNGNPGQSIYMKYGEILFPDGSVNGLTAVAAQIKYEGAGGPCAPIPAYQTDTYILKGAKAPAVETYQQMFTWHAFRYVEFTTDSWDTLPTISVYGIPLHADLPQIGLFESSNSLFNSIQQMVINTILSNMFSIQSDCPGRERFGYGGDAHASDKMVMLNFDMSNFYRKRVLDYRDASNYIEVKYGFSNIMPETAPFVGFADEGMGNYSGPIGWGTMYPQMQWLLYSFTGDTTLLESEYGKMKGWLGFLSEYASAHNNVIDVGLGDWMAVDAPNVNFTSNMFYMYNFILAGKIAAILGNTADERQFLFQASEILGLITVGYLKPGAIYDNGGQAAQSFALWFDIIPDELVDEAFGSLVAGIASQDNHLTTGMFSVLYMLELLSEFGRSDLAYAIVNQTTYPSFGYMVANGSTTVWESWFYSNDTYSHNHVMFGSVSAWFIEYVAGISQAPTSVAFNDILIQPQVEGGMEWARGSYASVRGNITTDWNVKNGTLCLQTTIPPNTQASVTLPLRFNDIKLHPEKARITESGIPLSEISEIESHFSKEKYAQVMQVGSGYYEFCVSA